MKKFRKILSIALTVLMIMQLGAVCLTAGAASDYTIESPYADVVWEGEGAWGAYKGTIHTHTTYSDGDDTLPVMIKEYYNQDYDFVANADHGITGVEWNKAPDTQLLYTYQLIIDNPYEHMTDEEFEGVTAGTYPLYDGTIRNKKMVCVVGANEFNNLSLTKNHVNGFFLPADKGNGFAGAENERGFDQALKFIEENGGLSHINHPGDWLGTNSNPDAVNDEANIKFFGDLILKYDSCLGMEVFNERNGTTGYDRILWDNLLMYTLPYGKTVIGYSNTDAHNTDNVDTSFSVFMMKENTVESIKETMQSGAIFGITRRLRPNDTIGPDFELDAMNKKDIPYPMFSKLVVDGHKITADVTDTEYVQFIANGKVISTVPVSGDGTVTLDLDTIKGAADFQYVRAEAISEGGICVSQALIINNGTEPLEFVAPELSLIEKLTNFFRGTKLYAIIMEIAAAL
ncbi:MAG: hypothetical protein U0M02_03995 [Acutalibacteraceae bacterium]|nr:hypothetical protein [Acutalibacteraceae bacterium]